MADKISEAMRRPHRYFYEDGLVEIGIGGFFLAIGLLLQILDAGKLNTSLLIVAAIGLLLLAIGSTFLLKKAILGFKERVTYPRTGYVSYKRDDPSKERWLVAGASLALVIALLVLPEKASQMAFVEGALLCIILGSIGYRVGLARFYLLGAAALLIGLAAALFTSGDIPGTTETFAGTGVVLIISGAYALRRYLRKHPTPAGN
jgi:hypothetical protein